MERASAIVESLISNAYKQIAPIQQIEPLLCFHRCSYLTSMGSNHGDEITHAPY